MTDADAVRELMTADRWIERVSAQRDRLPELAEFRDVETELRELARRVREIDESRTLIRALIEKADLESERLRLRERELRQRLDSSTAGPRELTALEHELSVVQRHFSEAEDGELELMSQLEPLDASRVEIATRAQPLAQRREELRTIVADLTASLDDELEDLRRRREETATAVSPGLRQRYEAAMARVGGSGAAQVTDGRCDGCRIALAPLDLDRWRAGAAGLEFTCPECERVLLP